MIAMELKPPTQSDRRYGLSKSAEVVVSTIPGIGGSLGVVLADALARPYNRRMEDWLTDLAVALHELEKRVGNFEDLAESEAFMDAVAAGMRIAVRSRQEKRKLLRNAVLNTALAVDPDEDRQHVFFDLIDRLPPTSFRLLKFLADPRYREDVIGYESPAERSGLVPIADIAQLLSPTTSAPGEHNGDVASFLTGSANASRARACLASARSAKPGMTRRMNTLLIT